VTGPDPVEALQKGPYNARAFAAASGGLNATSRAPAEARKWFFCAMSFLAPGPRHLVMRFTATQLGATVAAALALLVVSGRGVAGAALVGGCLSAAGSVVFGWRLFAPGVAPAGTLARALYRAELLKWLAIGVGLWLILGPLALRPVGVIAGVIAAQVGFWLALLRADWRATPNRP
jgi:F0F1-type ATP synthase assembly protein I